MDKKDMLLKAMLCLTMYCMDNKDIDEDMEYIKKDALKGSFDKLFLQIQQLIHKTGSRWSPSPS